MKEEKDKEFSTMKEKKEKDIERCNKDYKSTYTEYIQLKYLHDKIEKELKILHDFDGHDLKVENL